MKLNNKGALFIEYAMALALILAVAVAFLGSDGISNSISGIFNTTNNVLGLAAEKSSDTKEPKYGGLSISFLESSGFQQLLKNCGTFYPTAGDGSAAGIKDLPYATAVAEALAQELKLNTSDFTFTYNKSTGVLMYYAHPGKALYDSGARIDVIVTSMNKDGGVETIYSVDSSFGAGSFKDKQPGDAYYNKNGFWNGSKREYLYKK